MGEWGDQEGIGAGILDQLQQKGKQCFLHCSLKGSEVKEAILIKNRIAIISKTYFNELNRKTDNTIKAV